MSEDNVGPKLPLKALINRHKSKVLLAEVNNDFVDVLLSFLALPLGKIVRILEKHYGNETPVIGSLNTLYRGLHNLDSKHFCCKVSKQMLVNPTMSFEKELSLLQLDISKSDRQPAQYFGCQDSTCSRYASNICMHSDMAVCDCGKPLNRVVKVEAAKIPVADAGGGGGVLTLDVSSFLISDDLRVVPNVAGLLQTLNNLGITDIDGAEMRSLSFGINEIMDLLNLSLTSATPLTDLIIKRSETTMIERRNFLHEIGEDASSNKMVLKVSLQKSTDKFLFAEAAHEFVEFLFSLLLIPLGGVEKLLGMNSNMKNIDNLYTSLKDSIDDKYLTSPDSRNKLINPTLAHGYISKNQFLPLTEENLPKLTLIRNVVPSAYNGYSFEPTRTLVKSLKWRKGKGNYVKEETVFMVSDDLTVAPFTIASAIPILSGMGIPLSDVKEMDFHIGLEQALRILKASVTSKTALTDALVNPMLKKNKGRQPKQEPA